MNCMIHSSDFRVVEYCKVIMGAGVVCQYQIVVYRLALNEVKCQGMFRSEARMQRLLTQGVTRYVADYCRNVDKNKQN